MERKKEKKGFALIELLTVVAILGILVLIAVQRFTGYTDLAKIAQIKADTKTYEVEIGLKLFENERLTDGWEPISLETIKGYQTSNSLYSTGGLVDSDTLEGTFSKVDKSKLNAKSNLKGDFVYRSSGEVYYHESSLSNSPSDGNLTTGTGNETPGTPSTTDPMLPSITDPMLMDPKDVPYTDESKFTWVSSSNGYAAVGQTGKGYYNYTGTDEEVVKIPETINGNPMTSYFQMFASTGRDVKKVVSTNTSVTNMSSMFYYSPATTLDLSSFDTSNVTNMSGVFYSSKATSLDISKFNTSKVTDMSNMFTYTAATSLDVSKFDTSKVINMSNMFFGSEAMSLNLSSFNTSNVTKMNSMFQGSKATLLDLSNFDTSNVTNLISMFQGSKATSLDLSSFDTSKVMYMSYMFYDSKATSLDLSSFDNSKVADMSNMFTSSSATTGYAKTIADARKFNSSSSKPSSLVFVVK